VNAAIAEPFAMHRAALVVHALADADRDWLLQSLPEAERTMLAPLLTELRELGIPPDARLLDGAVDATAAGSQAAPEAHALDALDQAGFAALAVILAMEPPRVAAALIAARPAAWGERLLACVPREHAEAIRSISISPAASALQAAVEALLVPLVQERRRPAAQPTAWARLRRKLLAARASR
jgi:hypothetical protein